jgi:hypothetical protein
MKNSILIRRKNLIIIDPSTTKRSAPKNAVATMLKNIESLGFSFTKEVIDELSTYSITELNSFYKETVTTLKELVGANHGFAPMYPNFPSQVMEMSDGEFYLNALVHYVGIVFGENWLPKSEVEERFPLIDTVKLKVIGLGSESDYHGIIKNLVGANSSLSAQDKSEIEHFVMNHKDVSPICPDNIPYKENLTYLTSLLLRNNRECKVVLNKYYKTPTDILRLGSALSDGDVSLATNTKFKSFGRSGRKLLLGLLNNVKNGEEDLRLHGNKWKRLAHRLHPGDYKSRFPKAFKYIDDLRQGVKIHSFMGKVEVLIADKDYHGAAELLQSRPGVFARKLDQLLRYSNKKEKIVKLFSEVCSDVSTPVLLQVAKHFEVRNLTGERVVFPKGNSAKLVVMDSSRKKGKIGALITNSVGKLIDDALSTRFSDMESLGKVFIDPSLEDYLVPFSQRSASSSFRTIVRGSRVKMDDAEKNTIRLFMYWSNYPGNRVDLDLSAVFYSSDWNNTGNVSYSDRSITGVAYHGGDITDAPNGASEFIDINIENAIKNGHRYLVMSVNSYTHQKFSDMPISCVGWMMREANNSGEIYEPSTVENKLDLTSESTVNYPVIFDLETREVIYCDMGSRLPNRSSINNVNNDRSMNKYCETMSNLSILKPTLHKLFSLHATSRGELVDNVEDADIAFMSEVLEVKTDSEDTNVPTQILPYHMDEIMANYLK